MSICSKIILYISLSYNITKAKIGLIDWYDRIDPFVILGALPLKSYNKQLVEEGVKGIVCLCEEFETKYISNSPEEWSYLGIEHIRLSTPDFVGISTPDDLKAGIDFIHRFFQKNQSVYVHCKAGRTRSTTMVAGYLMQTYNLDPVQALNYIKSIRPHIQVTKKHKELLEKYHLSYVVPFYTVHNK